MINLAKSLSGRDLDKKLPTLHKLYTYLNHIFQSDEDKTANLPSGATITYNIKQSGVGYYLENFNLFEPYITTILLSYLKKGDTFIDVGANIGYYTILAGKAIGPNGSVLAIEPEPINLKYLRQNISQNQLTNAKVIASVASSIHGQVKLYLSPVSSGEHSLLRKTTKYIEVEAQTLDDLVINDGLKPRLIKIDVEGAEMNVLAGAKKTIASFKPVIIFEYSGQYTETIFSLKTLIDLGYNLYLIDEKDKETIKTDPSIIDALLSHKTHLNLLATPNQINP